LWVPKKWKNTLASEASRASVDQSKSAWDFTDHFPVTGAVSFNAVFSTSSKRVRCRQRRAHIGKLESDHLFGQGLRDFREALTSGDAALKLSREIAKYVTCDCHKPPPPPEPPRRILRMRSKIQLLRKKRKKRRTCAPLTIRARWR
jgi:hypothetical protein